MAPSTLAPILVLSLALGSVAAESTGNGPADATAEAAADIGTGSAALAQPSSEEAGAGAAAVAVVALLCRPAMFAAIKKAAFEHLAHQLRAYPAAERERAIDAAERKLRALMISSEKTECAGTVNLQLMARTWGYANLLSTQPEAASR